MSNFAEKLEATAEVLSAKMIKAANYAQALGYLNPQAVVIERYTPPSTTHGGILKPAEYRDRESRSSVWGRVLRVSEEPTDDESVLRMRKVVLPEMWVNFLSANPINAGYPDNKQVQLIAIQDVLLAMNAEQFAQWVKDKE